MDRQAGEVTVEIRDLAAVDPETHLLVPERVNLTSGTESTVTEGYTGSGRGQNAYLTPRK